MVRLVRPSKMAVSSMLNSYLLYLIYCNCLAKTGVDMIFIIVLVYRVVAKRLVIDLT